MRSLPMVLVTIASFLAWDARAAAPNPAEAKVFLGRGMEKDSAGDADGAIADYSRAIELDPKNAFAYVRRGMAHDARTEFQDALRDYSAALDNKSMDPNALAAVHAMRGDVYLRQDMRKEAGADFDRAIAINPKMPQAYLGRAITRLFAGEFDKAKADYEAVLKERPDDGASQYGLGIIAYAKQDWTAAESKFTALHKDSPDDPNVAIWAILSQRRSGKTVNAADFKAVNQAEWPGQVVANLLGNKGPLDTFIEEAEEHHDPNEESFACIGSFATFSLAQIEKRVDMAQLNDMQNNFQKCAALGIEGHIALNEIKTLKAR